MMLHTNVQKLIRTIEEKNTITQQIKQEINKQSNGEWEVETTLLTGTTFSFQIKGTITSNELTNLITQLGTETVTLKGIASETGRCTIGGVIHVEAKYEKGEDWANE